MFPCALFFIAIGTYSTNNAIFDVYEVMFFGIIGAILLALDFPVAPILLGYVLEPLVEENFRRALLLSQGDMAVFVQRPISAVFVGLCALLFLGQIYFGVRAARRKRRAAEEVLPSDVPALHSVPDIE